MTILLLVVNFPDTPLIGVNKMSLIASLQVCCLCLKLYDFLRLFESTANYIYLIQETLRSISAFIVLLFVALMMFGLPMLMLDFSRTEENSIVAHDTDGWLLNALLNQYFLSLGEFNTDNFAH